MLATYEALCEEGFSELTAQSIADRTEKSKSALFYHYDSKEELLGDFVEYLLEGFEGRVAETRDHSPLDRLAAFIELFLQGPSDDGVGFHTAMLELRAQAPYNEVYREKLRASDALLRESLVDILRAGIESGDFRDHEPTSVAELLLATFDGARIRRVTLDREAYADDVRSAVVDRILADVLAPETEFPTESTLSFPPDERLAGDGRDVNGEPAGAELSDGSSNGSDGSGDGDEIGESVAADERAEQTADSGDGAE